MSTKASFQVSLKVIFKNKEGKFLILKNPNDSQMRGYFDFPGGRIEKTEINISIEKVLAREIKEEVGNQVKYKLKMTPVALGRHFYYEKKYQKNKKFVLWVFFEAQYLKGKIILSQEHSGYKWIKLNKKNIEKLFIRGPLDGIRNYLSQKNKTLPKN